MTYRDYVAYAKAKGFQPLSIHAYNALVLAGYNPITNRWRGR